MRDKPLDAAGYLWWAFVTNTVILGLTAVSFNQGPYSSPEQELWYRYGSLGFLLIGVAFPTVALILGARRSRWTTVALTLWMYATLIAFLVYAFYSSGGV